MAVRRQPLGQLSRDRDRPAEGDRRPPGRRGEENPQRSTSACGWTVAFCAVSEPAKPRLLVVNQYYWPGVEATAHLLTELCEALADEYEIRVLTGVLRGHEQLPRREVRNGVEIVRVSSTAFERANLGLRALNYVSYIGSSLLQGLTGPRPDLVLCMTDPPMVGDVGPRRRQAIRRAAARHLRRRLPGDRHPARAAQQPAARGRRSAS